MYQQERYNIQDQLEDLQVKIEAFEGFGASADTNSFYYKDLVLKTRELQHSLERLEGKEADGPATNFACMVEKSASFEEFVDACWATVKVKFLTILLEL